MGARPTFKNSLSDADPRNIKYRLIKKTAVIQHKINSLHISSLIRTCCLPQQLIARGVLYGWIRFLSITHLGIFCASSQSFQ